MNCNDFLARHSDWYDDRLDGSAADELRAHAELCPSCARYDSVVRRGVELARDLPGVELSSDFEPRLRHRLYHERDAMARRRAASPGVFAVAASIVLVSAAAGAFAIAGSRTPVVDGQVVFAVAPPAVTSVESNAIVVREVPALARTHSKADAPVAPIEAESKGYDPHVASVTGWPVYSRRAVAVAFPATQPAIVVRPADFRQVGGRATVAPLLIRH